MSAPHADLTRRVDSQGRVWFSGDDAADLLLRGFDLDQLLLDSTPALAHYNACCQQFDKAQYYPPSDTAIPLAKRLATWWLDPPYDDLPVRDTLLARCLTTAERERVDREMDLFEARDLLPVLRLMFMLVDHFRRNGIVWGVGRGSSVASYVLFLIGVHRIDSLYYDLDIEEFLRD